MAISTSLLLEAAWRLFQSSLPSWVTAVKRFWLAPRVWRIERIKLLSMGQAGGGEAVFPGGDGHGRRFGCGAISERRSDEASTALYICIDGTERFFNTARGYCGDSMILSRDGEVLACLAGTGIYDMKR